MKLRNPFTESQRVLFIDHYFCALCGRSDQGIEIHHIYGRGSNVTLNMSPLCIVCHSHIRHDPDTHVLLFTKTLQWLFPRRYELTREDIEFIMERPELEKALIAYASEQTSRIHISEV